MPPKGAHTRKAKSKSAAARSKSTARAAKASPPAAVPPAFSPAYGRALAVAAPSSVGFILPRSSFGFAGPAQRLADYDSGSSLRVTGCDLFSQNIVAGSSTAAAGFGGTGSYYKSLSPSNISTRLQAVEEMFQWWAIRRLRVHYVPVVGSSTSVAVALGYSSDVELDGIANPTQQQIMELYPAVLTPCWQTASMEIKHDGTKLFESYLSTESLDLRVQGVLACTLTNSVASTAYGALWMEYVIDFYQQSPLLSSVDRERRRARGRIRDVYHRCAAQSGEIVRSSEGKLLLTVEASEPDSPVLLPAVAAGAAAGPPPASVRAVARAAEGGTLVPRRL